MPVNETPPALFGAGMARFYQDQMVPMIFEPHAAPMASRVAQLKPLRVLEIAAGTGALTRHLAARLDASARIQATDISADMLAVARTGTPDRVTWAQADAHALPFADAAFDVVVCQFGVMFFTDRVKAYSEIHRVLKPRGSFDFSTWAAIEENAFVDTVDTAVAALSPGQPPRFLRTVPHGYHDHQVIAEELARAGFSGTPWFEQVEADSAAPDAAHVASAYCRGTPLRLEIEANPAHSMAEAIARATEALVRRFGTGPISAKTSAHVIRVRS